MKSSRGDSASAFSASSATGLLQLEPSAIAGLAGLALAGPLVETYTCYRSSYVGSALQGTYLQCFNLSRDGSSVVPAEGSAMSHAAMNAGLLNLSNHNHFIGYGGIYISFFAWCFIKRVQYSIRRLLCIYICAYLRCSDLASYIQQRPFEQVRDMFYHYFVAESMF